MGVHQVIVHGNTYSCASSHSHTQYTVICPILQPLAKALRRVGGCVCEYKVLAAPPFTVFSISSEQFFKLASILDQICHCWATQGSEMTSSSCLYTYAACECRGSRTSKAVESEAPDFCSGRLLSSCLREEAYNNPLFLPSGPVVWRL